MFYFADRCLYEPWLRPPRTGCAIAVFVEYTRLSWIFNNVTPLPYGRPAASGGAKFEADQAREGPDARRARLSSQRRPQLHQHARERHLQRLGHHARKARQCAGHRPGRIPKCQEEAGAYR